MARAGGLTPYAYEPGAQLIRLNPAFYEELVIKEEIVRDSLQALRYQQRINRLNNLDDQRSSSGRNQNNADNRDQRYDAYAYEDDLLSEEAVVVPKYKNEGSRRPSALALNWRRFSKTPGRAMTCASSTATPWMCPASWKP